MTRNKTFTPEREPLRSTVALQLNSDEIHGPISFLNPTQARFSTVQPEKIQGTREVGEFGGTSPDEEVAASNVEFKWTSRNNRKGRHALVVPPSESNAPCRTPPPTNSAKEVLKGILRMFVFYPVWDISYLIAIVFTFGSVIWMMNAFLILLPLTTAETMSRREVLFTAGVTPFVATTTFVVGSLLLMLEAYNENRGGCFGWAVEQLYDQQLHRNDPEHGAVTRFTPSKDECTHHHQNILNIVGKPSERARASYIKKTNTASLDGLKRKKDKYWVWFPSWHDLRTHYIHEVGFLACSVQLFGILAYWISSIVVLPRINKALRDSSQLDEVYWS